VKKCNERELAPESELLQGIGFFVTEIARLQSMSWEQKKIALKDDGLKAFTPMVAGVKIRPCAAAAFDRIGKLAEEHLAKSKWRGKLFGHTVRDFAMALILEELEKSENPPDNDGAERIFSEAIAKSAEQCKEYTHYIPCHVMDDEHPKSFQIGSIEFQQVEEFLLENEGLFEQSIALHADRYLEVINLKGSVDLEQDRRDAIVDMRDRSDEGRAYLRKFRWIAKVAAPPAVYDLSRRHAERCVEAALNYLRLVFRSSYSNRIRVDSHPLTPHQSAALSQELGEPLSFTLIRSFEIGNSVGEDWWVKIDSGEDKVLVEEAGAIVEMLLQRQNIPPLAQRVLDALSWFGQAASDPAPATRVLKYVAAIERLTLYGERRKITNLVCDRVATLCCKVGGQDYISIKDQMEKVYGVRSGLVHGALSPYDEELNKIAFEAEGLAREVIFNFHSLAIGYALRDATITLESLKHALKFLYDKKGIQV
jgi:hypothetical protein